MSKVAPAPEQTTESPPDAPEGERVAEQVPVSWPAGVGDFGDQGPREEPAEPEGGPAKLDVTKRQTGLFDFSNTEAIKQKVRDAKLRGTPYNVFDFYYETGFFQKIAKHPYFENTTLAIIVVNALWISIDTDLNTADTIIQAEPIFVTADSMFFIYFSLELIIRFMAFERKCNCMKDGWFVFDSALVTLYAFDPFTIGLIAKAQGGKGLNLPTAVLRLFRLARLSRLVRMLRSLPELMIMIKGMMTAAASVGYTLGLLMLFTYVFSIALRNLVPKNCDHKDWDPCNPAGPWNANNVCVPKLWDGAAEGTEIAATWEEQLELDQDGPIEVTFFCSVPEAMHSLIVFATFLDDLGPGFMLQVKPQSAACMIITWVYIALGSLTVMNMLIGVLCEVISAVAAEEKESMIVDKVNEKFGDIVNELDQNKDGDLSWDEFQRLLDYPEALQALESVNVDPESMVDMAEDFFFEDGEPVKVSFEEFMEMVLDLRGGQQATVKDIMGLGKRFNKKVMKTRERFDGFEKTIKFMDDKVNLLLK